MSEKSVFVTGGAGFIGSHCCKALAKAGFHPIVLDNLVHGHRDAVKWGPLVEVDINDGAALEAAFSNYRPKLVLHFAAYAYVGESTKNPEKYYLNNVGGTLSLLAAMRRHDVNSIVFSSSCATYGIPKTLPILESTEQHPINPYGQSKLMVEKILKDYQKSFGLNWIALRYFNAAGCDPDGELGERHAPETHAIPLAIEAALGQKSAFDVMGTDYNTPDGSAIRDYVHVDDLADAHVKAAIHLMSGGASCAYNLGTEHGTSVLQMIQAVEKATGRHVPVNLVGRRAGDPPSLVANATKVRAELDWKPKYTDIDDIVKTAAAWFMTRDRGNDGPNFLPPFAAD